MSNKSGASSDIISLPQGGGALGGIGESFSPDLFTGTGNFSVPISVPSGRNGFQPDLKLVYSSGSGNGPFGLGWSLSVPGVSRKTSRGVPTYQGQDTFVLSGAEDLVRVDEEIDSASGQVVKETYRPRTEGLFARIERHRPTSGGDWWEVRTKGGNVSYYGTPDSAADDPAALTDPGDASKIFSWRLSKTVDSFGNEIRYTYIEDTAQEGPHDYTQVYPHKIQYVDYDDGEGATEFLVEVEFVWEERVDLDGEPIDAFSTYRQGFEVRTTRRCQRIDVRSNHFSGDDGVIRTYHLDYAEPDTLQNRLSILKQVVVEGKAGPDTQELPPLEFSYNDFDPTGRKFEAIEGAHLPTASLGSPTLETVDLFGNGLPDLVEMNGQFIRYWRNRGNGTFDWPRQMKRSPMGLSLADPQVQFIDAEGNGRADLLVSKPNLKGYFPLTFEGSWDEDGFVPYEVAPSVGFADPDVKLVDLTGDGLTDVLRSGTSFECFFNDRDPDQAWTETRRKQRAQLEEFPDVSFSDPRVRTADMTGDGLQDIVLIHSGRIDYWPNLGHGRFGVRVTMKNAPRFEWGYRPEHVLLGDVDGDGLADLIFIDDGSVTVWMNQSGNGFSDSVTIQGTPRVTDRDAVRLLDLKGTGSPGILWSREASQPGGAKMYFLDLTGGEKPYLLREMNNHMGAVTRVAYRPSTEYYLEDDQDPVTRWKTPLPFPVQTVWQVEVIDQISHGKLTTEYEYHHGYWDGEEREFRGFARVNQRDSEAFADYDSQGLAPGESFESVPIEEFSPPLESRHWFMLGGIWDASGDWKVPDFSGEWWGHADTANHPNQLLGDWAYQGDSDDPAVDGKTLQEKLGVLSVDKRREALRALRGRKLRSELYALDGSSREDRPFTVSESIHSIRDLSAEALPGEDHGIFFAYSLASRTTNWDRGDDPATSFEWSENYDPYGQPQKTTSIACPRGFTRPDLVPPEPFLSTHGTTRFIYRDVDGGQYMVDRTEESEAFEVVDGGSNTLISLKVAVDDGAAQKEIQAHAITYYDGPAFEGLAKGEIGAYGAPVRSESLVMTDAILEAAYPSTEGGAPVYLAAETPTWPSEYPTEFKNRIDAMDGRAGYRYDGATGRYYAASGGKKYDFQEGTGARGLALHMKNPVGHVTSVTYDQYELLPTQVDATISSTSTTLTTKASYDYRLFKPVEVTELNGNRVQVAYTPLGLVEKQAVMNEADATTPLGDTLTSPGTRFVYDLSDYELSQSPMSVRTIQRVQHVNHGQTPAPLDVDETIESIEFSDGFGRVIQSRAQAEELDYERADDANYASAGLPSEHGGGIQDAVPTTDPDRVRVSGWQRYNNKGKVVEKWEPFFASGFGFGDIPRAQSGKSVKVRFDARGRQVKSIRPDGAQSLVVFGEVPDITKPEQFNPTPWETYTYDANDNAGRTTIVGVDTSTLTGHFNTPTSAVVDALGRTLETIARNGTQELVSRTTYDIRGNVLTVVDPKGRIAARQFYDLADRTLRNESIDAGTSIAVFDAVGTPIEARDERGALTLTAADEMLRTTHQWGRDSATEAVRLVGRTIFGHELADPTATNHLGKPYRHYDEAGVVTLTAYDFKGNVLENIRQVINPALMIAEVDAADSSNGHVVDTFRVDWTGDLATRKAALIDNEDYRTAYKSKSVFDALNRPVQMTLPADEENADTEGYGKTITPQFNRAGALQSVQMSGTDTPSIDHIAYNAKGQRILAALGNGVMTRYTYDENVFRLRRMRSEKYASSSTPETGYTLPTDGTGKKYQDIVYTYDAVGNILSTDERVTDIGVGIAGADDAADTMVRDFAYDALYRLIEATGRESDIQKTNPWQDQLTVKSSAGYDDSPANTRRYTETYAYDEVGGLTRLVHAYGSSSAQWVRDYTTEAGSNRMTGLEVSGNTYTYAYDSGGNLVKENTERHFEWDFGGRMRVFRNQVEGSAATVFAHYSYDGGGQRVQKVVTRGAKTTRTVYIGGVFEHQQVIENDAVTVENQTLHLMDDAKRIATYRSGPELDGGDRPATRYHLGDHLQSSSVVLRQMPDANGELFVNREEYRPYGETAFGSFEYKRYRFTGKEKDEESGLHYHGARYYAPWAARWTAPDPLGMVDGPNLFQYVSGNPVRLVDPGGTNENEGGQEGSAVSSNDVCQVSTKDRLQAIANDSSMPAKARKSARQEIENIELMGTLAAKTREVENSSEEAGATRSETEDLRVNLTSVPWQQHKELAKLTETELKNGNYGTAAGSFALQVANVAQLAIGAAVDLTVGGAWNTGLTFGEGAVEGNTQKLIVGGAGLLMIGAPRLATSRAFRNFPANEIGAVKLPFGGSASSSAGALVGSTDDIVNAMGDDIALHYTKREAAENIVSNGVIRAGGKNRVYVTDELVSPEEAVNVLFAGMKGPKAAEWLVVFRMPQGQTMSRGSQGFVEKYVVGSVRLKSDDIVYAGPNPF